MNRLAPLWSRLTARLFGAEIERRISLAVRALDDVRDRVISGQHALDRDRFIADREEVLRDALDAWRVNPLARRIVSLTTQYIVGPGLTVAAKHQPTHDFLQAWWGHRLNRMPIRAAEWCDELTRSGNLIVLISTDAAGMSYVRALPAIHVQEIVAAPNDIEQARFIIEKPEWAPQTNAANSPTGVSRAPLAAPSENRVWPVYDEATDAPDESGAWPTVAVLYAINRPVGAAWGESDLAPLLRWLARYANWLEDRARLNRHRQSFMYVVRGLFKSAAERIARQSELNANPPTPGSILVTDANTEAWGVLHPQLDSFEAGEDGLALKKMIAAGSANPMHFLAEPESATRTTAEASGGPTFRHYEQRQEYFVWLMRDVAQIVARRRAALDPALAAGPLSAITVTAPDIAPKDNGELATATASIAAAFTDLRDRGLIDDAELMRVIYKFAAEPADVAELLANGAKAPPPKLPQPPNADRESANA